MMTIALITACLLVAFGFSGIEAGILSVNRVRLRHRVKMKDRAAIKLERLLARPGRLLATVLIVTNLASITAVTLGVRELVKYWGASGYLVALAVFAPVYLFGVELLPKALFRRFPYRSLAFLAEPLRLADLLLTPLLTLGEWLARWMGTAETEPRKLFAAREDFKYLTIETERGGALSNVERKMIHGVVDFRAVTARDVMIPIEQVVSISQHADLAELIVRSRETGIDRWPVCTEKGRFSGIVNMLDVALSGKRSGSFAGFQRRLVKLAPNEPAYTVLHKLRAARSQMAAVLDAEGQPLGVVTWEAVVLRLVKSAAT